MTSEVLTRRERLLVPAVAVVVALAAVVLAVTHSAEAEPEPRHESTLTVEPALPVAPVPAAPATPVAVENRHGVFGTWRVVEVAGGPVPAGALRRLWVQRLGRAWVILSYFDGVNSHSVRARLRPGGTLTRDGQVFSTLVGCLGPDGTYASCPSLRPSGFGVMDAVRLRLTRQDRLVLVDRHGAAAAVYERVT